MKHVLFTVAVLLSAHVAAQAVRPMPAPVQRPLIEPQTPRYPGTTYTPAGAGASHGRLITPGVQVQRAEGPMLPQSDEPTIYAAGKRPPPASPPPTGSVRGVELPHLDGVPYEFNISSWCASELNRRLYRLPTKLQERLSASHASSGRTQFSCLVARLYLVCTQDTFAGNAPRTEDGERALITIPQDRGDWDRKKALTDAARHVRQRCEKGNTPAVDAVVEWLREQYQQKP